MPVFRIKGGKAERLEPVIGFPKLEKGLQAFVEGNLDTLFGVRFVAHEFSTGGRHHGRIDTLGLDGDGAPVVIEYKHLENETVITQGLFYLDWLSDHRGDFERVAEKVLGNGLHFDWSAPRLVLLAQSFNRYDQYAVNRISERIELWTYTVYSDSTMTLTRLNAGEDAARRAGARGRAAPAAARMQIQYDLEHHKKRMSEQTLELYLKLRDEVLSFGNDVEERFLQQYIAFRHSRNFVAVKPQRANLKIWLGAEKVDDPRKLVRNVEKIGHHGTGDLELIISRPEDLGYALNLARQSYERTK